MKKTMICQSTATKEKRGKSGWTVCPCRYQQCCRLPIPENEPDTSQSQMHYLATGVLAACGCSGMGLIFWSDFSPQKVPTQCSVCCGMLQNPHQQAPKNRCCGMLQPLVLKAPAPPQHQPHPRALSMPRPPSKLSPLCVGGPRSKECHCLDGLRDMRHRPCTAPLRT